MRPDVALKQHLLLTSWESLKTGTDNVRRLQAAASNNRAICALVDERTCFLPEGQEGKGKIWKGARTTSKNAVSDMQQTCSLEERLMVKTRLRTHCPRAGVKPENFSVHRMDLHQPSPRGEMPQNVGTVGIWSCCRRLPEKETDHIKHRSRPSDSHDDTGRLLSSYRSEWILLERIVSSNCQTKVSCTLITGLDSGEARSVIPSGAVRGYSVVSNLKTSVAGCSI